LLTRGKGYADRVERAFAAEFLAPADGLREILMGDYSDSAQQIAADRLGVSPSVIEHQIDNQLAA
jgi:Zn-dependent peptidase ImmA (M78 family)